MKDDYSKKVVMNCPVCGNTSFEHDPEGEEGIVTCISCKKTFIKDEIFEVNHENIETNITNLEDEVMKDTINKVDKIFKKKFGNNYKIK